MNLLFSARLQFDANEWKKKTNMLSVTRIYDSRCVWFMLLDRIRLSENDNQSCSTSRPVSAACMKLQKGNAEQLICELVFA